MNRDRWVIFPIAPKLTIALEIFARTLTINIPGFRMSI